MFLSLFTEDTYMPTPSTCPSYPPHTTPCTPLPPITTHHVRVACECFAAHYHPPRQSGVRVLCRPLPPTTSEWRVSVLRVACRWCWPSRPWAPGGGIAGTTQCQFTNRADHLRHWKGAVRPLDGFPHACMMSRGGGGPATVIIVDIRCLVHIRCVDPR